MLDVKLIILSYLLDSVGHLGPMGATAFDVALGNHLKLGFIV